ncbi:hypothetical protein NM208_g14202 [Fusarium decemcellulare]|uniref:Uncharacterized protein n=1 Tax=Fusarium decemcellulare TaxID=57161 RepID=A0ACC1RIT2_9HYPO|nr:hypothetical protein NM208_g14202 [Fusarium decemcellulare]
MDTEDSRRKARHEERRRAQVKEDEKRPGGIKAAFKKLFGGDNDDDDDDKRVRASGDRLPSIRTLYFDEKCFYRVQKDGMFNSSPSRLVAESGFLGCVCVGVCVCVDSAICLASNILAQMSFSLPNKARVLPEKLDCFGYSQSRMHFFHISLLIAALVGQALASPCRPCRPSLGKSNNKGVPHSVAAIPSIIVLTPTRPSSATQADVVGRHSEEPKKETEFRKHDRPATKTYSKSEPEPEPEKHDRPTTKTYKKPQPKESNKLPEESVSQYDIAARVCKTEHGHVREPKTEHGNARPSLEAEDKRYTNEEQKHEDDIYKSLQNGIKERLQNGCKTDTAKTDVAETNMDKKEKAKDKDEEEEEDDDESGDDEEDEADEEDEVDEVDKRSADVGQGLEILTDENLVPEEKLSKEDRAVRIREQTRLLRDRYIQYRHLLADEIVQDLDAVFLKPGEKIPKKEKASGRKLSGEAKARQLKQQRESLGGLYLEYRDVLVKSLVRALDPVFLKHGQKLPEHSPKRGNAN